MHKSWIEPLRFMTRAKKSNKNIRKQLKENATLYRKLRLLRLQLKEQTVPAIRPLGLETLAKIVSSMEGEIQVETHHDEVTSPVREKGASSKKL